MMDAPVVLTGGWGRVVSSGSGVGVGSGSSVGGWVGADVGSGVGGTVDPLRGAVGSGTTAVTCAVGSAIAMSAPSRASPIAIGLSDEPDSPTAVAMAMSANNRTGRRRYLMNSRRSARPKPRRLEAIGGYQMPSSSLASSLIISRDQGGLQSSLTSVSPMPGRSLSALLTSCMMTGPSGQPSEVRVMVTSTSPVSSISASYTRP